MKIFKTIHMTRRFFELWLKVPNLNRLVLLELQYLLKDLSKNRNNPKISGKNTLQKIFKFFWNWDSFILEWAYSQGLHSNEINFFNPKVDQTFLVIFFNDFFRPWYIYNWFWKWLQLKGLICLAFHHQISNRFQKDLVKWFFIII